MVIFQKFKIYIKYCINSQSGCEMMKLLKFISQPALKSDTVVYSKLQEIYFQLTKKIITYFIKLLTKGLIVAHKVVVTWLF